MTTLAYSHTLVPGTPENVSDVMDMFNDVKILVNGNLDATNLAASAKPATLAAPYRTVSETPIAFGAGWAAGAYTPIVSGNPLLVTTTSLTPLAVFPVNTPDYAVTGLTTQFRVQATTLVNPTAPNASFTYSAAQVSSLGGGSSTISITGIGSLLGSVTRAAPLAGNAYVDTGSDFTISTSGVYVLLVTLSAVPPASSFTNIRLRLQVHNV